MHHWFHYPTNVSPIALKLGPIAIHWYGISYLIGFICVYLWMSRPAGRRRLGLTKEQIQDFLVYALVGVLVGGRTLFVIANIITRLNVHDPHYAHHSWHSIWMYYGAHPINLIAVWDGGMAFHGGLIGVIVALALFRRKHPQLKFTVLGDEVVMLLPIGIALTRVVNFINDELWGHICRPDYPWCMVPGNTAFWGPYYRHPSQLYEGILDIATLPILLYLYSRKPKDGVVAWSWFMLYGITRTTAEFWRAPGFMFLGLTGGQLLAVPMIFIGAYGVWWCWKHEPRTDVTPMDAKIEAAPPS
ncbi:MAG: prolipoprotein diacylglyceryl transferase [Vulcanimicrobiaceae bacterium]